MHVKSENESAGERPSRENVMRDMVQDTNARPSETNLCLVVRFGGGEHQGCITLILSDSHISAPCFPPQRHEDPTSEGEIDDIVR